MVSNGCWIYIGDHVFRYINVEGPWRTPETYIMLYVSSICNSNLKKGSVFWDKNKLRKNVRSMITTYVKFRASKTVLLIPEAFKPMLAEGREESETHVLHCSVYPGGRKKWRRRGTRRVSAVLMRFYFLTQVVCMLVRVILLYNSILYSLHI